MLAMKAAVRGGTLGAKLLQLVKLLASQVNRCSFCIDTHWKDCKAASESDQQLCSRGARRERPFEAEQERTALARTESFTRITETHAPNADFDQVRAHSSDSELAKLYWAIAAIHVWNRMAIDFRVPAAGYSPSKFVRATDISSCDDGHLFSRRSTPPERAAIRARAGSAGQARLRRLCRADRLCGAHRSWTRNRRCRPEARSRAAPSRAGANGSGRTRSDLRQARPGSQHAPRSDPDRMGRRIQSAPEQRPRC
ncbi:MAG: carboxymuconolactone decarboxylase family protein [Planctomycetes bacterium]|nr:carboxymuconolactone decarboxylase family protein [Planctomycetota bacterium]